MSVLETVKDLLYPDTEETVLYDLECQSCGATFTTGDEPAEASCRDCGSTDLEEEGRMYAGGAAGGAG